MKKLKLVAILLISGILTNAQNYLPLSGGTLTGALIGTSAMFRGDVSIDQPHGLFFANGQAIRDNGIGGLSITSGASINNTVDGGGYYSINGGNVGIGIASPAVKFQVVPSSDIPFQGSVPFQPTSAAFFSPVLSDNGYSSILQLVSVRQSLTTGNASNSYLGFSTVDNSNSNGIKDAARIAVVNEGGVNLWSPTALSFWTNTGGNSSNVATEGMRITSNGKVGIGTINPIAQLHVVNTSNDLQFQIGDGARDVSINAASSNITAEVLRYQSGANLLLGSSGILGKVSINTSGGERLTVMSSGNVGIGTASPSEKLSVNGIIRSKKLIVTQTGWSDYVFDSTYKLKSLTEVEQFIKANKHLSDIPSAKEVEKDGIDVGDNQVLLLKKIEELTLYIIETNKKMEQMKKAFQDQVTELKNQNHLLVTKTNLQ